MEKQNLAPRRHEVSMCHCTVLRKASRRVSQLYDLAIASSGLKTTQRTMLAQIARSEPTTVGQLAEIMVMNPGALGHTLKPLKRDGFISITIDPADRRNRQIGLTQSGRTKLEETAHLWEKAQRGFEAAFGRAESDALRDALRVLTSEAFVSTFESTLLR